MARVQVQVDMQFEVQDWDGEAPDFDGVDTERQYQEKVVHEVIAVLEGVLTGEGRPGECNGYARVKGAIDHRHMFGSLDKKWLKR